MSEFRTRLLGVLGSVVSLSACGAKVESADEGMSSSPSERSSAEEAIATTLRKGLDGSASELCSDQEEGPETAFGYSRVHGLNPVEPRDYLEWRNVFVSDGNAMMPLDGAGILAWEGTKRRLVEDTSLTDAERQQELELAFTRYAYTMQSSGTCVLAAGCDRFVLTTERGFVPSSYYGSTEQLLAAGPSGSTVVTNKGELLAFLGEIDTPHEAALIVELNGFHIRCDGPAYKAESGGYLIYAEKGSGCGQGDDITGHRLRVGRDGATQELDSNVVEKANASCVIGRLPAGAVAKRCRERDEHPVGRYFADVARLEAASILAFRELARDLAHYGAPPELVAWARRAAVEETEHALMCQALARRYGVDPGVVRVAPSATRSLLDIARDNAFEGLTREAFGALVAHHQMHTAKDPVVRAAFERIAGDETSHAEFSIALHRWLETRLDSTERASVAAERRRAQAEFGDASHPIYASEVLTLAGLPTPEVSQALFNDLFREDWAA